MSFWIKPRFTLIDLVAFIVLSAIIRHSFWL